MSAEQRRGPIRPCRADEIDAVLQIINAAAERYRGAIPADCWHEPYMAANELARDMGEGVDLWGYERDGVLVGVMGLQPVEDVCLIRHAYVRPDLQGAGIGGALLRHLESLPPRPILIGTWAAAGWAIAFYRAHGFDLAPAAATESLLVKYWNVPRRQMAHSVVLTRAADRDRPAA